MSHYRRKPIEGKLEVWSCSPTSALAPRDKFQVPTRMRFREQTLRDQCACLTSFRASEAVVLCGLLNIHHQCQRFHKQAKAHKELKKPGSDATRCRPSKLPTMRLCGRAKHVASLLKQQPKPQEHHRWCTSCDGKGQPQQLWPGSR